MTARVRARGPGRRSGADGAGVRPRRRRPGRTVAPRAGARPPGAAGPTARAHGGDVTRHMRRRSGADGAGVRPRRSRPAPAHGPLFICRVTSPLRRAVLPRPRPPLMRASTAGPGSTWAGLNLGRAGHGPGQGPGRVRALVRGGYSAGRAMDVEGRWGSKAGAAAARALPRWMRTATRRWMRTASGRLLEAGVVAAHPQQQRGYSAGRSRPV
jgi:hypothetical protein